MNKLFDKLFSTSYAGLYFLLMGLAMATGTFIENDYGTSTAQKLIYHAKWFEVLHLLFAITLLVNIFKFKLYKIAKLPSFIFHISIVVIIIGAAITRYISYEGTLQIKEGTSNNVMMSDRSFLQMKIVDDMEVYSQREHIKFGTYFKNSFEEKYKIKDKEFSVKLIDFIPNLSYAPVATDDGDALLHIITTGMEGRDSKYLSQNQNVDINGLNVKFYEDNDSTSIHIKQDEEGILWFKSPIDIYRLSMLTRLSDTLEANTYHKFETKHLNTINGVNIVLKDHFKHGKLIAKSDGIKLDRNKKNLLVFEFKNDKETKLVEIEGGIGIIGSTEHFSLGDYQMSVTYGPKPVRLPFSIFLEDFELERYAGSNTPSSYASDVRLIDKRSSINMPFRIYMNNILSHDGYRLFQSSYTPDEKSTILSINHDYWGTLVSYIGYFSMTFGFILSLFFGRSRFKILAEKLDKLRDKRKEIAVIAFLFLSTAMSAANPKYVLPDSFRIVDPIIAKEFGKIQIQDHKGRIKPINTYSSEILRKIAYKTSIYGQNSDQVLLGIINHPEIWENIPLIKVTHPTLKQILGIEDNWAPFSKFLESNLNYVLQPYVEKAAQTNSSIRGTFEREVLKVDERFNVLFMAFTGQLLKVFPLEGDPSKKWYAPTDIQKMDFKDANIFVQNYFRLLHTSLDKKEDTSYINNVIETINFLNLYQHKVAGDMVLTTNKLNYELTYNKYNIFARLIGVYAILGFILLILLFAQLIKPRLKLKWPIYVLITLILLSFLAHTFNIGLRWYLSERAPWSNGYESLTFIAWATMLSGVIFFRKSFITLASTSLLAMIILGVAALNWMDPEITNLVPVLKSYWLTIHVSIITSSYGFLGLGALLGFFTLILYIIINKENKARIDLTIKELSYVNEMTITVGVFLLATGTYLGGVWANESWGRYWGWDSKETWALISIMVYAFILHMRLIPGLKGIYKFSVASILGIASIIMTYFGVNYYLSGLHSYATGDPVPIPSYTYYTLAIVIIIAIIANWRIRKSK